MTYYEIKKVFSKNGSKAALAIIVIVISVVLYFIIGENEYVNQNGETEMGVAAISKVRELKKEWSGELTEAVIRKVIEENLRVSQTPEAKSDDFRQNDIAYSKKQGFIDIRDLLNYDYGEFNDYNYYLADSLSPDVAAAFYSNRIKNLIEWLETDAKNEFSEKEKDYLLQKYEELKIPLYYDYQAGWKSLFQHSPTIIMILTLILGYICAGIFSSEFQQKSSAVFYSSYYGRNRAIWAKIKAGVIIITAIYWCVMLIYTMLVLGILGSDGVNCFIQSSVKGWKSIYNITNGQEYILLVFCGYLGCLFMLSLTMLISARINSSVMAVTVPFGMIFLPSFLAGLNWSLLNKVLGLLPDQLLQINQTVNLFNLYEIGDRVFCAIPLLIILYSVLTLLIILITYLIYRKKEVY